MMTKLDHLLEMVRGIRAGIKRSPGMSHKRERDGPSSRLLKPCPFCGNQPTVEPWHGGGPTKHRIGCNDERCHARPSVTGYNKSVAVARWNSRRTK